MNRRDFLKLSALFVASTIIPPLSFDNDKKYFLSLSKNTEFLDEPENNDYSKIELYRENFTTNEDNFTYNNQAIIFSESISTWGIITSIFIQDEKGNIIFSHKLDSERCVSTGVTVLFQKEHFVMGENIFTQ